MFESRIDGISSNCLSFRFRKNGLHSVADLCFQKAHYTAEMISGIHGFEIVNSHPFFHEFVVKCPKSIQDINKYCVMTSSADLISAKLSRVTTHMRH